MSGRVNPPRKGKSLRRGEREERGRGEWEGMECRWNEEEEGRDDEMRMRGIL